MSTINLWASYTYGCYIAAIQDLLAYSRISVFGNVDYTSLAPYNSSM